VITESGVFVAVALIEHRIGHLNATNTPIPIQGKPVNNPTNQFRMSVCQGLCIKPLWNKMIVIFITCRVTTKPIHHFSRDRVFPSAVIRVYKTTPFLVTPIAPLGTQVGFAPIAGLIGNEIFRRPLFGIPGLR
jgi:hypothetical protein